MKRITVYFSGRVQGVGFRLAVRQEVKGFDVTGTVRNLIDGRVELVAEGEEQELLDFLEAIDQSHLGGFIQEKEMRWSEARRDLKGFSILPS